MKSILNFIFFGIAAYVGWDYYSYTSDSGSELGAKKAEFDSKSNDVAAKQKKAADAKEFFRTLEKKREELRALSTELATMKSTLTESIDTPIFMKLVLTEAKKVGLSVTSLSPLASSQKNFYVEYPFEMSYRGVYVQLIAFLDRLSQAERIVRVDDFSVKPRSGTTKGSKYVDLEGTIKIRSFVYKGTDEDSVAREGGSDKVKAQTQGAAAAKPKGGTP